MTIVFDVGTDRKHKKPLHDNNEHAAVEAKQNSFQKVKIFIVALSLVP